MKRAAQRFEERNFFHGPSPGRVAGICENNFRKYAFFAKKASFSHPYSTGDFGLPQFIFLAKVLVDFDTKGHSSYGKPTVKPPSKPASYNRLYDSCVNDISNPTMFVAFDADHFYPEYIIKYLAPPLSPLRISSLQLPLNRGTVNACNPCGPATRKPYNLGLPSTSIQKGTPTSYIAPNLYLLGLVGDRPTGTSNNIGTASKPSVTAA